MTIYIMHKKFLKKLTDRASTVEDFDRITIKAKVLLFLEGIYV